MIAIAANVIACRSVAIIRPYLIRIPIPCSETSREPDALYQAAKRLSRATSVLAYRSSEARKPNARRVSRPKGGKRETTNAGAERLPKVAGLITRLPSVALRVYRRATEGNESALTVGVSTARQ
jgi:hypothetical protein